MAEQMTENRRAMLIRNFGPGIIDKLDHAVTVMREHEIDPLGPMQACAQHRCDAVRMRCEARGEQAWFPIIGDLDECGSPLADRHVWVTKLS